MRKWYWWLGGIVSGLLVLGGMIFTIFLCDPAAELTCAVKAPVIPTDVDEATGKRVVAFCSACHAMPPASSFSRDAWHHEVMQGYHFYAKSGRTDLDPPTPSEAIAYFRYRTTDELVFSTSTDSTASFRRAFTAEHLLIQTSDPVPPAISNIKWIPRPGERTGTMFATDMRRGTVHQISLDRGQLTQMNLGQFGHPCHVEPVDLNNDGTLDFVLADLGSFDPDDHDRGRVLWHGLFPGPKRKPVVLAAELGRIADVRPADLNGDGRTDLVVAEFGWHKTGGIHVLRNTGNVDGTPQFHSDRVYSRPGTIHVPVVDIDGDGDLDIVALVSQEHERVELIVNKGDNTWQVHTLWAAPDPAFGLSGMELVDLDLDGDIDILVTNGDTFDSMSLKPSHGIQWLRNDGGLRFTYQRLADLSGAYRALAADFDNDGDLDIAACVWVPRLSTSVGVDVHSLGALVIYEQTGAMKFERHTLQEGAPCFATMEIADFDRDGDQDIALGWFLSSRNQSDNWISVWWNEQPTQPEARP